jgi:hypothetical protein
MNLSRPVTRQPEAVDYKAWTYTVSEADLEDYYDAGFIREPEHVFRGRRISTQKWETVPLDKPLCKGCDTPIDNMTCADCDLVFVLEARPTENGGSIWL